MLNNLDSQVSFMDGKHLDEWEYKLQSLKPLEKEQQKDQFLQIGYAILNIRKTDPKSTLILNCLFGGFSYFYFPSIHKALMKRNEGTDLKTDLPNGTAIKLYLYQSDIQQNALKISSQ